MPIIHMFPKKIHRHKVHNGQVWYIKLSFMGDEGGVTTCEACRGALCLCWGWLKRGCNTYIVAKYNAGLDL